MSYTSDILQIYFRYTSDILQIHFKLINIILLDSGLICYFSF